MTPIPILSKPRLVKLAICGHCGQYPCRVSWVRIRNTGAQCVIWVYGLFWIVDVKLLDINVGLILYQSLIKIPFLLDFRVGDFSHFFDGLLCCVVPWKQPLQDVLTSTKIRYKKS